MMQLKSNSDIEFSGFTLDEFGLRPSGSPTFTQWVEVGKFIKRSHKSVRFWQGDWLNFGEKNFDEWEQYFDKNDPDSKPLLEDKWVAKMIPPSRRRSKLSWSHHREVADLEEEDQENMLKVAEENRMELSKFKAFVKVYQSKLNLPDISTEDMKSTDPQVFQQVQEVIDSSIHTIELMEKLPFGSVHEDARDYLFSHLRRVIGFNLDILKRYDKQRSLSEKVV